MSKIQIKSIILGDEIGIPILNIIANTAIINFIVY